METLTINDCSELGSKTWTTEAKANEVDEFCLGVI
jgi:hypothetical protein